MLIVYDERSEPRRHPCSLVCGEGKTVDLSGNFRERSVGCRVGSAHVLEATGSSRALKENLEPANGDRVLDALTKLDLYEWSYIDQRARHFGPMAEEFSAAYGLGESKAKIAPSDMAGLALAASKTLAEQNEALGSENWELKVQLSDLKEQFSAMLERLEAVEKQQ